MRCKMEEHQIKQQAENKGCEKCGTVVGWWVVL